ncbi:MAG: DUF2723 domain-containing protein [Anaerolineae bacterium]|nr:DUF2723 domain-containing protein [Anaerolineae bacterium]
MTKTQSTEQPVITRIVLLAALAASLLALGLYLLTLHPGVGPSLDSMELQIAALVRGVIHPPGSPQYLMLGSAAMSVLPGPNPAYRLNLLSAIFAATAVGVTFLLTYRLTHGMAVSLFASLLLALSPRLWYQASIAELYSLNALYVSLVLYLLVTWHQTRQPAAYWAATTVYAFSFGNHLTMLLLLPVFLYTVESTDRAILTRPRNLAITTGIVLVAAAQYLYIPLRAAAVSPFCNYCPNTSGTFIENGRALLDYLTGGPFKSQMFALSLREILERIPEAIGLIGRQFMPWGAALLVVGIWELFQKQVEYAWMLVLGMVAEIMFVLAYAIPDWHDFLTPVYVIATPLIGYGTLQLVEKIHPEIETLFKSRPSTRNLTVVGMVVLMAAALLTSFYAYFPAVDQSEDTGYMVNSRALLEQAEPGAWVLMPHPNSPAFYYSWAVRYTSLAENLPPDLSLVAAPEVDPPPGPEPTYIPWSAAEDALILDAMREGDQQVFVLDWADDRFEDWGLLPVCVPDTDAIAGYEVAAVMEDGHPTPLVDSTRWAAIESTVVFDGSEPFVCPAE